MPTCRDIISRALRKLGYIGRTENPSDADARMGMDALQSMFDEWAAGGTFGPLRDVYKDAAYTARAGERVRTTAAVTLPPYDSTSPNAGCCDDYGMVSGCDSRPMNRALIVVINPTTGTRVTNLWDAWRGQWVELEALTVTDEAPLAALGADGLACCLARALQDDTGQELGSETKRRAQAFENRIKQGADSRRDATHGVYC